MLRNVMLGFAVPLLFMAMGCSFKGAPYIPVAERPAALQPKPGSSNKTNLEVTQPTGMTKPTICRLSAPVSLDGDKTYAEYIQSALRAELNASGIANDTSAGLVKVVLDEVDFNSNIGFGNWTIAGKVTNAQGLSSPVKVRYDFDASFTWWSACSEVASTVAPATRRFAEQVFASPAFQQALGR